MGGGASESVLTRVRGSVRAGIEAREPRSVDGGGGDTGVDKRVLSIRNCEMHEWTERPAADNLLNSPTCTNIRCAHSAQKKKLGAPKTHFDPGKTLVQYVNQVDNIIQSLPRQQHTCSCNVPHAAAYLCHGHQLHG